MVDFLIDGPKYDKIGFTAEKAWRRAVSRRISEFHFEYIKYTFFLDPDIICKVN
jgi:hypothetical protein